MVTSDGLSFVEDKFVKNNLFGLTSDILKLFLARILVNIVGTDVKEIIVCPPH